MLHFSRYGRAVAASFLAVLAAFLMVGRTGAISIRLPLTELSARSPLVVRGTVERIESGWNAQGQIDSTVYVRLSENPRGRLSAGDLIPVRVHGGKVGDLTMTSSEEPTFDVGEDLLLFLAAKQGDAYRLAAGEQSQFRIAGDQAENRAWGKKLRLSELEEGVRHGRWPADPSPSGAAPGSSADSTDLPLPRSAGALSTASGADTAAATYVLNAAKWFGPQPMEESFVVNVNSNDAETANGSAEEFRNAILAAAYTWDTAGAAFSFKYGGLTNTTSWNDDGRNVIYWQNLGNSPTLAEAQWWTDGRGKIVDVDLRFNDYYVWNATGRPSSGQPDLQSIATHELGHWLSLGHDNDPNCPKSTPVMCASYVLGTLKRFLGASDVAGIKAIYGSAANPINLKARIYLPFIRR